MCMAEELIVRSSKQKGDNRYERWERNSEGECVLITQVSISQSFFDWCFRPRKRDTLTQISRTQLKKVMQWERKVGTYLTQISISQSTHLANSSDRPKRRGGEMSSGKSEGRVCMPLRYLYPSQFWFPIGQTKARKRKPERGYALHSDSRISVKSCNIFF